MKDIKFNQDSKVIVTEDTGQVQKVRDPFSGEIGSRKIARNYVAEADINLGSIVNPNKKIISIKFDVPPKGGRPNIFGGLFG